MEAKVGHVRKNKVPPENVEEKALLEVASQYSNVSPHNILVIEGTLTLPEISGYKRFRRRSKNVDFVVNRKGLEDFLSYQSGNNEEDSTMWWPEGEAYTTRNKGILCTFFPDGIEGYVIPEEEFSRAIPRETSVGSVYTISDELNLALKVRRGIQGKDAQDAASTIVGAVLSGRDFDAEAFADSG